MGGGYSEKLIFIIIIGILLIIGASFALWQITLKQTNQNEVAASCFKIEFKEKNNISLTNAYPVTDEEGKKFIPYEFSIENICDSATAYQVNLEVLNTSTLENLGFLKVMLDDNISILSTNEEVTKTLDDANKSYKLQTGYIDVFEKKEFELRLWLDENMPTSEEFMEKIFESKVTITTSYLEDLNNNIKVVATSQNEGYSDSETISIQAKSDKINIVAISEDGESWEEVEKSRKITFKKTFTTTESHTYYFKDELGTIKEFTVTPTKIDTIDPIANITLKKEGENIVIDASRSIDNESGIKKYYYSLNGEDWIESEDSQYETKDNGISYGISTEAIKSIPTVDAYVRVEDNVGNMSETKKVTLERSGISSSLAYDETVDNNLRYIGSNPSNYVRFNNELWRIIGVMNNVDDGTGKKETRLKIIRTTASTMYWNTTVMVNWAAASSQQYLNGTFYNGLTEEAKAMITPAIWHLGSNGYKSYLTASNYYTVERRTRVYTGSSIWTGNVAILYPSDYGFATNGGSNEGRNKCLNITLGDWGNNSSCKNNNWLYSTFKGKGIWFITAQPDYQYYAMLFSWEGNIGFSHVASSQNIAPTLYLSSNVKITSGTGLNTDPFTLSLN